MIGSQDHLNSPVHQGDIIAGKYRVERILGAGGMGVVVAATHVRLDERVALKFLLPQFLSDPEVVERFEREARAAVKLKGEHVARVQDVGNLESGSPYIVMEFLEGETLAQLVATGGRLPVEEATDYLLQVCTAIAEAHALGIVHRDLKPANLFRTRRPDGRPLIKVLDFGISKVLPSHASLEERAVTKTSATMGSPLYMSPEQMVSARDVDVRSDIWSLGIILYELLAGRAPFDAESIPKVCALILEHPPTPLLHHRPELPAALAATTERCLAKDPAARFATVGELATALEPFAAVEHRGAGVRIAQILGVRAEMVESSPRSAIAFDATLRSDVEVSAVPQDTGLSWKQASQSGTSRRKKWLPLLLGGAVLLVAAGALFVVLAPSSRAPLSTPSLSDSTTSIATQAAPLSPSVSAPATSGTGVAAAEGTASASGPASAAPKLPAQTGPSKVQSKTVAPGPTKASKTTQPIDPGSYR